MKKKATGTGEINVRYKTPAAEENHVPWEQNGNWLVFDDELSVNLKKNEREEDTHLDVCQDNYGSLVLGVIPGVAERYVAEIDISARTYHDEETGETDPQTGEPIVIPVPDPFTPEKVTLTLWETEE